MLSGAWIFCNPLLIAAQLSYHKKCGHSISSSQSAHTCSSNIYVLHSIISSLCLLLHCSLYLSVCWWMLPPKHSSSGPSEQQPNHTAARTASSSHASIQQNKQPSKLLCSQQSHVHTGLLLVSSTAGRAQHIKCQCHHFSVTGSHTHMPLTSPDQSSFLSSLIAEPNMMHLLPQTPSRQSSCRCSEQLEVAQELECPQLHPLMVTVGKIPR